MMDNNEDLGIAEISKQFEGTDLLHPDVLNEVKERGGALALAVSQKLREQAETLETYLMISPVFKTIIAGVGVIEMVNTYREAFPNFETNVDIASLTMHILGILISVTSISLIRNMEREGQQIVSTVVDQSQQLDQGLAEQTAHV